MKHKISHDEIEINLQWLCLWDNNTLWVIFDKLASVINPSNLVKRNIMIQ